MGKAKNGRLLVIRQRSDNRSCSCSTSRGIMVARIVTLLWTDKWVPLNLMISLFCLDVIQRLLIYFLVLH